MYVRTMQSLNSLGRKSQRRVCLLALLVLLALPALPALLEAARVDARATLHKQKLAKRAFCVFVLGFNFLSYRGAWVNSFGILLLGKFAKQQTALLALLALLEAARAKGSNYVLELSE